MPPVERISGAYFAEPGSDECFELDQRLKRDEFWAKITGELVFARRRESVELFVPEGVNPAVAGGVLAMARKAIYFSGSIAVWRG